MSSGLALVSGAGLGVGVVLVVAELLPSHPDLRAALAQLNPATAQDERLGVSAFQDRYRRALSVRALTTRPALRVSAGDLDLVGRSHEHLVATKLGLAALALLAPPMGTVAAAAAGFGLPVGLPVFASLGLATVAFFLPDRDVRRHADRAREEFTGTVAAYLVLVALERKADAGPVQALNGSARVGCSWPWQRIRDALDRAYLDRRPAWDGLHDLATSIGVPALAEVADIVRTSGEEGTAIAETLLARARSLRVELAARQQATANADSERMVIPVALLGLGFVALLAYPVFSRITTG